METMIVRHGCVDKKKKKIKTPPIIKINNNVEDCAALAEVSMYTH